MMKFWKSAAKGKTGCPVRPPESNAGINISNLICSQSVDNNEETQHMYEKKSKLSLNLHNILIEKKGHKYLIQFMESIGQETLIKCWLEMDQFKIMLRNSIPNQSDNHTKVNRTQSFDLHCKCKPDKQTDKLHRLRWRQSGDTYFNLNNVNTINECSSSSSCGNLIDQYNNVNIESEASQEINKTNEAIEIFKKYVALEAPYQLHIPDSVRKSVISDICHPEGQIKGDCFQPVQDILYNQMDEKYFNEFMKSPLYIKAQIDILTNCSLNLNDILYNETILFYFTEYLEQESCRVLLEFLMAITHFRDNFSNGSCESNQIQSDAIILYDKYISLQASHPVGFPTDIRLNIESEICREGGPLLTCFDLPFQIVYKTLTQYARKFLESEIYYKYISEMIHSVEMWSANHKSLSDCSSEYSISTQNTLLAMGDPVFRRKKRNHSVPDMTIDSNQLYNANALWQRNRHDGLSLGRVNSLGRFESKLEPDPDRKVSVLKKMVSKFVPTDTSRVEEEMAWQIAHMIVKDVTDLTMAPPDNEPEDV